MGLARVDRTVRDDIQRQYLDRRPRVGPELDDFVAECCEYYRLGEEEVRSVVSAAQKVFQRQFNQTVLSIAQQVAEIHTLTPERIMRKLSELLDAETKKPILDKNGRPVRNEQTGEIETLRIPDRRTQLQAIEMVNKIQGNYAPKRLEVEGEIRHTFEELSDDELQRELSSIERQLTGQPIDARFEVESSTAHRRGEAAQGGERRVLLADAMHPNSGRAGSAEPIQAIPTGHLRAGIDSDAHA